MRVASVALFYLPWKHLRVLRTAWETKFARLRSTLLSGEKLGKTYSTTMLGCAEAVALLASRQAK